MTKLIKNLALFIGIAFLLPLLMVLVQFESNNEGISFILYGIQAAAPTIAAVVVFMRNKELKQSLSHLIRKGHLITALTLPIVIICVIMLPAKGIASLFTEESGPFFGTISIRQGIIILWSIVAEEVGWRGYLEPVLIKLGVSNRRTPCIVGLIWCTWHYHYFWQKGIEVPLVLFLIGCIVESYIYSCLMRSTQNNLVSAMMFHFTYNLFIHLVMINPSDNNGSTIPYVIMLFLEAIVSVILILLEERDKKCSHAT